MNRIIKVISNQGFSSIHNSQWPVKKDRENVSSTALRISRFMKDNILKHKGKLILPCPSYKNTNCMIDTIIGKVALVTR